MMIVSPGLERCAGHQVPAFLRARSPPRAAPVPARRVHALGSRASRMLLWRHDRGRWLFGRAGSPHSSDDLRWSGQCDRPSGSCRCRLPVSAGDRACRPDRATSIPACFCGAPRTWTWRRGAVILPRPTSRPLHLARRLGHGHGLLPPRGEPRPLGIDPNQRGHSPRRRPARAVGGRELQALVRKVVPAFPARARVTPDAPRELPPVRMPHLEGAVAAPRADRETHVTRGPRGETVGHRRPNRDRWSGARSGLASGSPTPSGRSGGGRLRT